MINFERKVLDNGLSVLIHEDTSTPLVAINILYKVGSRNERPERTGLAHLFEHLMFSGSKNVPDFDTPIQNAGGENNAFTNNDSTNFYEILPANNIETALWLESDRMKHLVCSNEDFLTQQKVVLEEFKETTLNQPYGDVWHIISEQCYKKHPYRWPTIGMVPEHIEQVTLDEVQDFYSKYYHPSNAIIAISGNISPDEGFRLVEKWFGDIQGKQPVIQNWEMEDPQLDFFTITKKAKVPLRSLYLNFHMYERAHPGFYVCDVISDILSAGRSSRFFQRLFKEKEVFSFIDAYITGTVDPGLFLVEAKPNQKFNEADAIKYIWEELEELKAGKIGAEELEKVKNKIESALVYSEVNILNKAINLAYFDMLGNAELINQQTDFYRNVSVEDIQNVAKEIFTEQNCSEIIYLPQE